MVAWTVNDRDALCRMQKLGVDVVTTDDPERARKIMYDASTDPA